MGFPLQLIIGRGVTKELPSVLSGVVASPLLFVGGVGVAVIPDFHLVSLDEGDSLSIGVVDPDIAVRSVPVPLDVLISVVLDSVMVCPEEVVSSAGLVVSSPDSELVKLVVLSLLLVLVAELSNSVADVALEVEVL